MSGSRDPPLNEHEGGNVGRIKGGQLESAGGGASASQGSRPGFLKRLFGLGKPPPKRDLVLDIEIHTPLLEKADHMLANQVYTVMTDTFSSVRHVHDRLPQWLQRMLEPQSFEDRRKCFADYFREEVLWEEGEKHLSIRRRVLSSRNLLESMRLELRLLFCFVEEKLLHLDLVFETTAAVAIDPFWLTSCSDEIRERLGRRGLLRFMEVCAGFQYSLDSRELWRRCRYSYAKLQDECEIVMVKLKSLLESFERLRLIPLLWECICALTFESNCREFENTLTHLISRFRPSRHEISKSVATTEELEMLFSKSLQVDEGLGRHMETWDALFDGCLVSWMDSRHHHLGRKVETEVIEKWENPLREYEPGSLLRLRAVSDELEAILKSCGLNMQAKAFRDRFKRIVLEDVLPKARTSALLYQKSCRTCLQANLLDVDSVAQELVEAVDVGLPLNFIKEVLLEIHPFFSCEEFPSGTTLGSLLERIVLSALGSPEGTHNAWEFFVSLLGAKALGDMDEVTQLVRHFSDVHIREIAHGDVAVLDSN
mgnify:FL=1